MTLKIDLSPYWRVQEDCREFSDKYVNAALGVNIQLGDKTTIAEDWLNERRWHWTGQFSSKEGLIIYKFCDGSCLYVKE